MLKSKFLTATILASLALPSSVFAATQQLPGLIDRDILEVEIPKSFSLDGEVKKPIKEAPFLKKEDSKNIVATISRVEFSGVNVIPQERLDNVVADFLNRPLTKMDIARLKYELTRLFYEDGYILVKIVTPPQNISSGVLKIEVYEAKVGDLDIRNDGSLRSAIVDGMSNRIAKGDIFRENTIESVVSDVNDLKNLEATINLQPGKLFGTTDITLLVDKADEDEQKLTIDNYGSPLTGRNVATLHLEKSNLLKLGETFSADIRRSDDELWSIALRATTPTGLSNTKLEFHYIYSENEIGDRLAVLNASGKSERFGVALSKNILNMRNKKLTVTGGFESRTHESFRFNITETKDDIRKVYGQVSYLERTDNAVYLANVKVSTGIDAFGANNEGGFMATNANGDPDAWIINPLILANVSSPFSDGVFKFIGTGQLSTNELLSSELFILGGYGSVRGFDPAQETGESGYQFSLEYNHNFPQIADTWVVKAGPFLDGGTVLNRETPAVDRELYSAGIGIEASADLIKRGRTVFRLDWAHPLGGYQSNQIDSDTIYFRVSQAF